MPKIITANPNQNEEISRNSEQARRNTAIHALRDSMIRNKILTGRVSSIGHSEEQDYVTVLYDGIRVIIPIEKMGFTERAMETKHRANVTANSMAGAEIDFIVEHVDAERGAATASRAAAMKQKAKDFFIGDGERKPIVSPGSLVEARIIGVMDYSLRIEVFGLEKYVKSRFLARKWISDCRDKYEVGGTIVMRVNDIKVDGDTVVDIDVEGVTLNEDFKSSCEVGGRYVGEVTGFDNGIYFISLDEGSNAIAHINGAMGHLPRRKDVVAFIVTRIMPDGKTAAGKIVRIINRYKGN